MRPLTCTTAVAAPSTSSTKDGESIYPLWPSVGTHAWRKRHSNCTSFGTSWGGAVPSRKGLRCRIFVGELKLSIFSRQHAEPRPPRMREREEGSVFCWLGPWPERKQCRGARPPRNGAAVPCVSRRQDYVPPPRLFTRRRPHPPPAADEGASTHPPPTTNRPSLPPQPSLRLSGTSGALCRPVSTAPRHPPLPSGPRPR